MSRGRIDRELNLLREGGQEAELIFLSANEAYVLYRNVPATRTLHGLPSSTDIVVPVPSGYPAPPIDLAALPVDSPFLPLVKGGLNSQGIRSVCGRDWQLASYHPHQGGGGPPWDQMKHGFHTYFDHLISWLDRI